MQKAYYLPVSYRLVRAISELRDLHFPGTYQTIQLSPRLRSQPLCHLNLVL